MMYLDCSLNKPNWEPHENTVLTVLDDDRMISVTYEQIMVYHGGAMPAGVALAYRMFSHLFQVYESRFHEPPKRGEASFCSGLGEHGQGIIDTAEMLLRVKKTDGLILDTAQCQDKQAPDAPGGGKYYFYGNLGIMKWTAALKDNVIPRDFFAASAKMHHKKRSGIPITPQDTAELMTLRKRTEQAILSCTPQELFLFTIEN